MIKVIHGIEGDANKVKISPCKIKQPNLEVLKYTKGSKYPEEEVWKYVYSIRGVQPREVTQYVRIKLSVAHDVTWDNWYTTIRGRWMKKGDKHNKLCNLDCVDLIWFGWVGQSTWNMALTNDLCEVNKRHSEISLGMNYKQCADVRKW